MTDFTTIISGMTTSWGSGDTNTRSWVVPAEVPLCQLVCYNRS